MWLCNPPTCNGWVGSHTAFSVPDRVATEPDAPRLTSHRGRVPGGEVSVDKPFIFTLTVLPMDWLLLIDGSSPHPRPLRYRSLTVIKGSKVSSALMQTIRFATTSHVRLISGCDPVATSLQTRNDCACRKPPSWHQPPSPKNGGNARRQTRNGSGSLQRGDAKPHSQPDSRRAASFANTLPIAF